MKKFFWSFILVLLCLLYSCRAIKSVPRVPRLDVSEIICIEEVVPLIEEEKIGFINSVVARVWNEDFGKFTYLFYKDFFKLPKTKRCEFEKLVFTLEMVLSVECLLRYLYNGSTQLCLDFFASWVDFYKGFHCTDSKKGIVFESLKGFICRFFAYMAKNFYMTDELMRRRTEIICELYDLEDKKTLSL